MKRKSIVFLSLLIFIFTFIPLTAIASDLEDQLEDKNNDINSTKDEINIKKASAEDLMKEIEKLDVNINSLEKEVDKLQEDIDQVNTQLEKTKNALIIAQQNKEKQKNLLDERTKIMYMYGNNGYMEILFGARNFSDLISRIDAVRTIIKYDKEVFNELNAIELEIENTKNQIEEEKVNLQTLEGQKQQSIDNLENKRSQRNRYLSEITKDLKKLEDVLDQELREADEIKNLILQEQIGSGEFNNEKGNMMWPVPGKYRISSPYGWRIHPISHTKKFHTGVDIPAPTGHKIVSPGYGQVIMARYYGGYGYTIIIDLGNGISTLMAHNSKLIANVGDIVKPGDVVAYAGSTGNSTGPHSHFEIRVNGNHTNPLPWVKK